MPSSRLLKKSSRDVILSEAKDLLYRFPGRNSRGFAALSMTGGSFEQSAKGLLKILILTLALVNVAMAAQSSAQTAQDIGDKVYCQCGGCVTTLNHCPHLNCPVKSEMHKIIDTDLAQGKSEPAVLQDLVNRYGERVLAAPPAHGFNLAAWILPGVGLLIGLFLAITFVRRWRRPALQAAGPAVAVNDSVRAAVEEEMKKFAN